MPSEYPRLGQELAALATFYPNAALRESPGKARLAVGGPVNGRILASDGEALRIAQTVPTQLQLFVDEGVPEISMSVDIYSATEIGIYGRLYRTWTLAGMAPTIHVGLVVLALIDMSPLEAEKVRVAT